MTRQEYLLRAREFASRGEHRHNAKMCPSKVRRIRENKAGETAKELAARYNVHYRTIEKIRHYETWAHV